MSKIVFVIILLASYYAQACMFPIQGEEYDSLIEITRVENNKYKVVVPHEVEGRKEPIIILGYYSDSSDELLFADEFEMLSVVHRGSESIAYFKIEKTTGKTPFINVNRPISCCLCSVIAKSKVIEYKE
jgi:hypothetical protein